MRIYFATNRNPNDPTNPTDFGQYISYNGLTDLRFGWAEVNEHNLDDIRLTVADEVLNVGLSNVKANNFQGQKLGSNVVFEALRKEMLTLKQDCVVFIHGFNTSFREAIQVMAELKQFYGELPLSYFLFTWPSDGSMLPFKAYASDRDDARASGVALGRGLLKFADFLRNVPVDDYCNQRVHVMTHSMGAYALRWALQGIQEMSGHLPRRLLDQILLFAADEDEDAFEYHDKLKGLPNLAKRITIYHNPSDKALILSDFTKHNPDRLGVSGPRNSWSLPDKVNVVDCESVTWFGNDSSGHLYYRLNNFVKQDVIEVLQGKATQEIDGRTYQPDTRSYRLAPDE